MVKSLKEWMEENPSHDENEVLSEVAPPGFSGTVRAMKVHHPELFKDKDNNPYALAWYMHKKGDTPHYKEMPKKDSRKGKPVKKKKYKSENKKKTSKKPVKKKVAKKKAAPKPKKFSEWAEQRQAPDPVFNLNEAVQAVGAAPEEIRGMSAFQIVQRLKGKQLPNNIGPFAYAVMLKYGVAK